jgi:Flp pilus assembly protein TadG
VSNEGALTTRTPASGHTERGGGLIRLWSARAGATSLEFALVGLIFFGLLIGVVEMGRVLWTINALHYGA